jgi:hypothetical protein
MKISVPSFHKTLLSYAHPGITRDVPVHSPVQHLALSPQSKHPSFRSTEMPNSPISGHHSNLAPRWPVYLAEWTT